MLIIERANDQVWKCAPMMKNTGNCFELTSPGDD